MPPKKYFAFIAFLLATLIWAVATPVIKITLTHIPLFSFLFFRFLIVCILLLPPLFLQLKRIHVDKRDLLNLFVLGLLGQASVILIFAGLKFTGAVDATIIGIVSPIIVIWAGHYFYHEQIKTRLKIGLALAATGTLLVMVEPLLSAGGNGPAVLARIGGNILVLLYSVTFAAYIVLSKRVMGKDTLELKGTARFFGLTAMRKDYSPFLHTSLSFFVALIVTFPFFILETLGFLGSQTFYTGSWDTVALLGILYMAIFSSIVAYMAFGWGLRTARVLDSAVMGYLGPIFTLPAVYLLLGELPTKTAIVGSVIIAAGVLVAERHKKV